MSDSPTGHDAGWYEIRLEGRLGSRWAGRFDGMTLTAGDDGTTRVAGPVTDQAALHRLLRTVGDLGLPLISLSRLHPEPDTSTPGD